MVQGNCTVVIGEDAALVVDTGQFPSLARRMVADIKRLTDKPVRYTANTHWHGAHVPQPTQAARFTSVLAMA